MSVTTKTNLIIIILGLFLTQKHQVTRFGAHLLRIAQAMVHIKLGLVIDLFRNLIFLQLT